MTEMSKAEAKDEIENLQKGMSSKHPSLYVWPNEQTHRTHESFMDRFKQHKFGFLPIRGSVGAGKTRFALKVKGDLRKEKMAVSHVVLEDAGKV